MTTQSLADILEGLRIAIEELARRLDALEARSRSGKRGAE